MMQASETMPSNLRPWVSPQSRPKRHPLFGSVEDILRSAFPLAEDKLDGRLLTALTALLASCEAIPTPHDAVRLAI